MSWFMTADTRGFLDTAGDFLRADPARNTVMLTVTEDLRINAASAGTLFGWWQPDGEPAGVGRLAYGGITIWAADGVPVSVAGRTRAVAGMVRLGPVYTPPELRGHGYAGAAIAVVSQAALDAGLREVVLYTDLANPTSNG